MAEQKLSHSSPLLGALARATVWSSARLPLAVARSFGSLLGQLAWWLPTGLGKVSRHNVNWCFPGLTAAERRRICHRSLIETGRTMAETGALLSWPPERLAALEEGVEGERLLTTALEAGRGLLIFLPHLGNWEMFNPFLMARTPFAALYRPPRVAQLSRLVVEARERTGCTMIPATAAGLRRLYRQIDRGRPVVILPDQEPVERSGVFAPFFGIEALTMTLPARLLRRLQIPALFGFALRTPSGGFRFYLHQPPEGLNDPDPQRAARQLNLGVERCVRVCPEQYLWSYKRFRTRPEPEREKLRRIGNPPGVPLYKRRRDPPRTG